MSKRCAEEKTLWCCGLPLVERVPLSEQERHALSTHAGRWLHGALSIVLIPPTIILAGLFALVLVNELPENRWTGSLALFILTLLPLQGLFILFARDGFRWYRRLRADLEHGIKYQFQGKPDGSIDDYPLLYTLFSNRMRLEDGEITLPDEEIVLEVLPISRRVWRVNDAPCTKWLVALVKEK